jgi:acetylornithine deacetylase/succinyl-diaminopimelate desuccinylase-like protein
MIRARTVGLPWIAAAALLCSAVAGAQTGEDSTTSLLRALIRANSSNPPGRTQSVDDILAARFRALGFEVKIVPTPDSAKAHIIARLRGDGSKRPVLVAAHADVVGVEREKWSLEPFDAIEKDGYVYGRGAIDFKGGMAVFARAVMMLAERKVPLARDWIMKGDDGHVRYVSISTADKMSIPLTIMAHGTSTHSSMPRPDNAIFALSRGMAKISAYETPLTISASTKRFFLALSKTSAPPMSGYYRDVVGDDPVKARRADSIVSRDPLLHSLIRNTIAPVIINGGFRNNVIPGSAQAMINLRLIPGTDPAAVVATLKQVAGDPGLDFSIGSRAYTSAPESPDTTALYRALEKEAHATFPGAEVTPYLFQAGTDAGAWRSRGVPVYGIYPYPIDADELTRMHGNDEKVSIESLRLGTEMIYKTLLEVAGRK